MARILVDLNLSPTWCDFLIARGHEARHWSQIGAATAPDHELMAWAKENGFVVFTHDLDFGAILASTQGTAPRVIQIRAQDVIPEAMGLTMINALEQFKAELAKGAIVVVEPRRQRARILPLT